MTTYSYGEGEAARRRKLLHNHIIAQRLIPDALPTTVRSEYYVGTMNGWWPDDATFLDETMKAYDARGEKRPSRPRSMSQNISDDIQWLIDRGYVGENEVVDEMQQVYDFLGVDDIFNEVYSSARHVVINPWSPNPVPYLLAEGNNDMTFIRPLGERNRCHWAPLGGMGGRGLLRKVAAAIDPAAPVGYVGDWNKSGTDIERNAERFLRSKGWAGTWTRLAITDTQAAGMTQKMKTDRRFKVLTTMASIESAAMPVVAIRGAVQTWLTAQLPAVPDANEDDRDDLVEWLALFNALGDPLITRSEIAADVRALVTRRRA